MNILWIALEIYKIEKILNYNVLIKKFQARVLNYILPHF